MVATRGTSAPAPSAPTRPTTQENVSLSLVDILEEVQLQVPLESRPQVELLIRLARDKRDARHGVERVFCVGPEPETRTVGAARRFGDWIDVGQPRLIQRPMLRVRR